MLFEKKRVNRILEDIMYIEKAEKVAKETLDKNEYEIARIKIEKFKEVKKGLVFSLLSVLEDYFKDIGEIQVSPKS